MPSQIVSYYILILAASILLVLFIVIIWPKLKRKLFPQKPVYLTTARKEKQLATLYERKFK